jgi:hypothetical protein
MARHDERRCTAHCPPPPFHRGTGAFAGVIVLVLPDQVRGTKIILVLLALVRCSVMTLDKD